ncbi:hypothetical protein AB1Y20_019389 [Prymnesium parvum]|uniref:Uncharacterized protein n=1 Tax=Prymnesium parvum TaxID=97485 RepID=A0AB34JSH4_PRYPA
MLNFSVDRAAWPAAAAQQRVALVTGSYDRVVDGVALTLNRLVAHLLRQGHEVLVLAPRTPRQPVLHHAGAAVHHVFSLPLPIWSEYRLTFGLGRQGLARLSAFRPTVLHIAVQDALGHAVQRWGRQNGVASICSHHTRYERYLQFYHLPVNPLEAAYWWGMRRFHAHCALTFPPSASLAALLRAKGVERVRVWPRGVDRDLFDPSSRSKEWRESIGEPGSGTPIVLLVARLRWEKGLSDFAAVIHELETLGVPHRVAIVGNGPARSALQRRLPKATFLGTLTSTPLAVAYASSDVFLYPSTTEGWGATCLEAQASGVPVVATTSPGIVDVVDAGRSGILTAPNDVTAMADAVRLLLSDATIRRQMGRHAVWHAARFDWSVSSDLILSAYKEIAPPAVGAGDDIRPPPTVLDRIINWYSPMRASNMPSNMTSSNSFISRV